MKDGDQILLTYSEEHQSFLSENGIKLIYHYNESPNSYCNLDGDLKTCEDVPILINEKDEKYNDLVLKNQKLEEELNSLHFNHNRILAVNKSLELKLKESKQPKETVELYKKYKKLKKLFNRVINEI